MKTNATAITQYLEIEGYDDLISCLEDQMGDPGIPNAICMNDDCTYTELMEMDQDAGWCDECKTNTLKSICILAGVI